jgi:RNA polymerase sigma factor (sigma-70 family)
VATPHPAPVVSDAELAARARLGDKDAFAALVVRHGDAARRLAERVLDDADLARDAGQEAIVVALVSLDRLAKPGSFGPWLCGIALNVARRLLQEARRVGPLISVDLTDPAPGPEEVAESAVLAQRVRGAVADLAPGQREAVLLFYLQGLSHREVAAELGISLGAVKSRLHQARGALEPRLSLLVAEHVEEEAVTTSSQAAGPVWIDVSIAGIRRPAGDDADTQIHTVILREADGERELPVGVLAASAVSLAVILESVDMPRPMTHQLAVDLLDAAGARISEVRITQLLEGSFYAVVLIDGPAGRQEVDARPSDALSLASIVTAPIRVDDRVFANPSATAGVAWRDSPNTASDLADVVRRNLQVRAEAHKRL